MELLPELDRRRSQDGAKIGFTNGVFDLIHPGHVRYLGAARAMADVLVVAVNDDASVRRLKGENRPVLPQLERAKILASFEFVDYVTLFAEDTPLEVIKAVRPDVLAKGADYTLDQIVGRAEVEAAGGVVKTVELVAGASSTNVISRILESSRRP